MNEMIMSKEELSKAMQKTKREIVIKNLHKLLSLVKEYEDCIDYAIDELEQKSCEDCVDRAEVLKIYDEWFATCNISDKKESPKAKINALSPVTPIRPKGQWIEERNDYGEVTHWHCSNCYDNSGFITTCKWDFCPNCGSDNREVKE